MSIQGSVYWMAPEVLQSKGYSAKIDIWSLWCLFFEMITGKRPWSNLDEMQTIWQLSKGGSPISGLMDIPHDDAINAFFDVCFKCNPDNRPTIDELMEHSITKLDDHVDYTSFFEELECISLKKNLTSISASSTSMHSSATSCNGSNNGSNCSRSTCTDTSKPSSFINSE